MDYNSLKNYVTSLALLYAWTLFAAAAFALGEKFFSGLFAQRRPIASWPATGIMIPVVHEGHELRQGPMAGVVGDGAMHLQADVAVLRMPLRPGAQLEHVHGLAGIELHGVADPVGQGDRVGSL